MSKKKVQEELHLNENDLTAWVEKRLGHLKPYASQITLVALLIFAAFIAIAYYVNYRQTTYADQWRELSLANTDYQLNGNTARLIEVADDYPDQPAGIWSLLMAGDDDLRTGINQLTYDRENGFNVIKRARDNLQRVVDAPAAIKSPELQRRSLFSLAYAHESLGEFDRAKELYQELVDNASDSPFAEPAKRGVKRCGNPELIALFDKFKNWKDLSEDAPGANVPDRPNIEFQLPDDPEEESTSGGDFEGALDGDTESSESPDADTSADTDESTGADDGDSNDQN